MALVPRVAIYVRVSTLDQSTDLQRVELEEHARARGWTVVAVYDDSGKTGTNTNRPQLKALMTAARARKFDVVLVWKLDRFARGLKDLLSMMQELSDLGVAFVSLRDSIDLTTAAGRLMIHMIGAFSEFEAALIRERVMAGLKNARAKGKRLGRPKTRDDDKIRLLRAQGLSIRKIAAAVGMSTFTIQRALKP